MAQPPGRRKPNRAVSTETVRQSVRQWRPELAGVGATLRASCDALQGDAGACGRRRGAARTAATPANHAIGPRSVPTHDHVACATLMTGEGRGRGCEVRSHGGRGGREGRRRSGGQSAGASVRGTLRRYRVAAGLSQGALAARAGLSERGVSELERGRLRAPRRRRWPPLPRRCASAPAGAQRSRPRSATGAAPPGRGRCPDPPGGQRLGPAARGPATTCPGPSPASSAATARWPRCGRRWPARPLVTLTGPGSCGKTRLALVAAAAAVPAYPVGAGLLR